MKEKISREINKIKQFLKNMKCMVERVVKIQSLIMTHSLKKLGILLMKL